MQDDASDGDLLGMVGHADSTAYESLTRRYHGLVHTACRRQAPPEQLDDCVQAVFLVLLRKPHQARRAPALAAWLLTVARHVCATARRAAGTRQRAEQEAAMHTASSSPSAPADAASEHLDSCLAQLPERQRTVIALHYLAGTSREQVARDLHIDVDTVHQHCRRGLERLRELLRRRGVAVPAVGVIALLSTQARAAFAANATFVPTAAGANAAAYASGAMTAMTISTLAPASLITVAVLTLVAGATIGIANAETVTPPAPPPAVVAPANGVLQDGLATPVTLDISQMGLTDVVTLVSKLSKLPIVIDPAVAVSKLPQVTISVSDMAVDNLLRWVGRMTKTRPEIRDGAVHIVPGLPQERPESALTTAWKAVLVKKLAQVTSFDFADTPFADVIGFMHQIGNINIVAVMGSTEPPPITFHVQKMQLSQVLTWISQLANSRYEIRDQAIGIFPAQAPAAPATVQPILKAAPAPTDQPAAVPGVKMF